MKHQHFFHQKPGTKSSHVNFDSPAKQWKKDFFIECAHNHICYRQFMLGVIQQLRRQEGVGKWSVKYLRALDRYRKNESKMSNFVYKG